MIKFNINKFKNHVISHFITISYGNAYQRGLSFNINIYDCIIDLLYWETDEAMNNCTWHAIF